MRFWLSFLIAGCCVLHAGNAFCDEDAFAIVIHGDAGKASSSKQWRESKAAALERALRKGKAMLESGASSLDTVEMVVRILEDDPFCNAGKGAVCTSKGAHELDATIMDGRDRSAGGVTTVKNPISLARRVMTHTKHVLLVTSGAEEFANEFESDPMIERVPNTYFATKYRLDQFERTSKQSEAKEGSNGTVGCVALDKKGNLAAATSTGGLTNKKYGRLGDSPIAGAGTYADNETCAVSCTGIGEDFIRNAVAYDMSARMNYLGVSVDQAAKDILSSQTKRVRGGIIAISHDGQIVMRFNTDAMARGAADSNGRFEVQVAE